MLDQAFIMVLGRPEKGLTGLIRVLQGSDKGLINFDCKGFIRGSRRVVVGVLL